MPEVVAIAAQSMHAIFMSIITFAIRLKTANKNILMKVILIGFSVADFLLNVHLVISVSKGYLFDINKIPKYWQDIYTWCNAAATIQMLGLNGYVFLLPYTGVAIKKGMQFGYHWSARTVLCLLIAIISFIFTYTLTMTLTLTFFGPENGSLTNACSYIFIGSNSQSLLWTLSVISFSAFSTSSICLVIGFYGMALRSVIDTNKEMIKIKAVSTGKRMGAKVVIKHFILTILCPCLTLLVAHYHSCSSFSPN